MTAYIRLRFFLFFLITVLFSPAVFSQESQLLSPLNARSFYDIGYELYTAENAGLAESLEAIAFMNAAVELDSRAGYVLGDIINIAWKYPVEDFSEVVLLALSNYVDRSADLEITSKAVSYLLERLNSREERERLLNDLIYKYNQKNIVFTSDLFAQFGFLKAETADLLEAQKYLVRAFAANNYNRLAFAKAVELSQSGGQAIPDIVRLKSLRSNVGANPLDIDSAYSFGNSCMAMALPTPAAAAFEYCSDLYRYLYSKDAFNIELYRRWLQSCYASGQYKKCAKVYRIVEETGIIDVRSQAFASFAALKDGNEKQMQRILDAMDIRGQRILDGNEPAEAEVYLDYAWFMLFVADPNLPEQKQWAQKAYDLAPNSPDAAGFLAMALANNSEYEKAEALAADSGSGSVPMLYAAALLLLKNQDTAKASELLNQVIQLVPTGFEAFRAGQLLDSLKVEHQDITDYEPFLTMLKEQFGQHYFSPFMPPEKMFDVSLNIRGRTFNYGSPIKGSLVITNKSEEPMVIGNDCMLNGRIRIDAQVSGDLDMLLPSLLVQTVRPSYAIRPGDALYIPVRFDTGRLKCLINCHPQAELELSYKAYLDCRSDDDGKTLLCAFDKQPAEITIKRPAVKLNTKYLQQRFDILDRGHPGQKAKSAQLFAGLLAEQQKRPAYRYFSVASDLLSSALVKCLKSDDWSLQVQTMAAVDMVKLDYRLTQSVSPLISSRYWPVRFMAVHILAKNQGKEFRPVLQWASEKDENAVVRQLASGLLTFENN